MPSYSAAAPGSNGRDVESLVMRPPSRMGREDTREASSRAGHLGDGKERPVETLRELAQEHELARLDLVTRELAVRRDGDRRRRVEHLLREQQPEPLHPRRLRREAPWSVELDFETAGAFLRLLLRPLALLLLVHLLQLPGLDLEPERLVDSRGKARHLGPEGARLVETGARPHDGHRHRLARGGAEERGPV